MKKLTHVLMALVVVVGSVQVSSAQYFGFAPRGVYIAPVVPVAPAGVRIRTPFFSLDTGPGYTSYRFGYGPAVPRYAYPAPLYRPTYTYRSYAYGPSASYSYSLARPYSYPTPYSSIEPAPRVSPAPPSPNLYRPGPNGGVPELTQMTPDSISTGAVNLRQLSDSAQTLGRQLLGRADDADVWIDYLAPEKVAAAALAGTLTAEVAALANNYEGVAANPALGSIVRTPGFQATRLGLISWVQRDGGIGNTDIGDAGLNDSSIRDSGPSVLDSSPIDEDRTPVPAPGLPATESESEVQVLPTPTPVPDVKPAE